VHIAHSHEFSMAVYGSWAARRAGVPHVITMHGGRYYNERLRRRIALRAAVASSAATIAVSAEAARNLRRDLWLPASRITTVSNGVPYEDPARVTLREELGLSASDRLIVAVGNLYAVKGHCHLIEALSLIAERHPAAHVAIAGRGPLEGGLVRQARTLGIEPHVHLLGLRADVPAILAAADVFALPSLSEGLPLALIEAMFAARPIVATRVGDVPLALADGDAGMLVAPGDAIALARAIDHLLGDRAEAARLAARAVARARQEYGIGRMVDRHLDLYRSFTAGAAGPLALSPVRP
jgi:glycosyltransferase involved in cell wall biosynthesis